MLIPAAVLVFSIVVELLLRWKGSNAWALAGYGAAGAVAITWWCRHAAARTGLARDQHAPADRDDVVVAA